MRGHGRVWGYRELHFGCWPWTYIYCTHTYIYAYADTRMCVQILYTYLGMCIRAFVCTQFACVCTFVYDDYPVLPHELSSTGRTKPFFEGLLFGRQKLVPRVDALPNTGRGSTRACSFDDRLGPKHYHYIKTAQVSFYWCGYVRARWCVYIHTYKTHTYPTYIYII